jgi:hypothetical protein
MAMNAAAYDVRCFLCSAEVGLIQSGRFVHDPTCRRPVPRGGGRLRCCRCAGPLYLEPSLEAAPGPVDWARLAREAEAEVA